MTLTMQMDRIPLRGFMRQISAKEAEMTVLDSKFTQVKQAAEQGDVEAQYNLGLMYYEDEDGEEDSRAAIWFTKAAEQEHVDAQRYLAVIYGDGFGVEKDNNQAIAWLHKAAEQGNAEDQVSLADEYRHRGVEAQENDQNEDAQIAYHQAINFYHKAAEQGHASAQFAIGLMYGRGEGVIQDHAQSLAWLLKAAEQGVNLAQSFVGSMYSMGHGCKQDDKLAYAWLSVAASNTNNPFDAIKERDKVAQRLTHIALVDAQALADQYINQYLSRKV